MMVLYRVFSYAPFRENNLAFLVALRRITILTGIPIFVVTTTGPKMFFS